MKEKKGKKSTHIYIQLYTIILKIHFLELVIIIFYKYITFEMQYENNLRS